MYIKKTLESIDYTRIRTCIYDSLSNTTISYNDDGYLKYLDNSTNSCVIDKCNVTTTENSIHENNISLRYENKECLQFNESESEQISRSTSSESIPNMTPENSNENETDNFQSSLAVWATEYEIPHTALSALLHTLK